MLAALVKKEWVALLRDLHGLAAMFVMPALFIVVMSLALKDIYSSPIGALRYAVDARDSGVQATLLLQRWQRTHGAALPLPADWQGQLRSGRLQYVIVLEPGLSAELDTPALPTEPRIGLLTEPGIDGNLFNSLRAELVGAGGEAKARAAFSAPGGPDDAGTSSMARLVKAERFAGNVGPRPSAVQQNVPSWLVFGMFFVVASLSTLLIQERQSGALGRLQAMGVSRVTLLASKALPYLGVNALQAVVMMAVGVWLMPLIGGDALSLRGANVGALLLSLAAISVAAVSLALALACLVRSHAQAATVGPFLNVLMAALGGIMVPAFVMPAFMQRVSAMSPMNWGLEALLTVLLRGGGVADVLPNVLRLAGFAVVMSLLAALLFRRRAA